MDTASKSVTSIPVSKLHFDPNNPRLPSSVDGKDENNVLEWMLKEATLIELMGSIGETGYSMGEPLLVVPKQDDNTHYYVVEGNRRLAAVKLLSNPETAPIRKVQVKEAAESTKHKPLELPAIVYPQRADITYYLGYRHITGVKPWDPLAKAKYAADLFEQIANEIQVLSQGYWQPL